jgi:hypothetical protein
MFQQVASVSDGAQRRSKEKDVFQQERLCRESNLCVGAGSGHDPSADYRPD